MAELLIEIGLEEIPAPWLAGLGDQLASQLQAAAEREFLEPHDVRALWAPRRLVLSAQVLPQQKDREERTFGPPVKAARTPDGAWTPAAIGFARKNGCRPEDLTEGFKEGAADPYVVSTRTIAGRPAVDVLGDVLATTLRSLSFPKRMSWDAWLDDGRGAFPFGRPIRWLVFLLDGEVVPFVIHALRDGGKGPVVVESGRETRGQGEGEGDHWRPARGSRPAARGGAGRVAMWRRGFVGHGAHPTPGRARGTRPWCARRPRPPGRPGRSRAPAPPAPRRR